MKLYIDSTNNQLISDPKFATGVSSISFKRGDSDNLYVGFVADGTLTTPTTALDIVFGVKPTGAYDSTQFLVYTDTPTIEGSYYVLNPNFNTQALNDLLMVDGLSTNDIASVTCMGELTFSSLSATWESTNTFSVVVNNDVIRNNESTPTALATPEEWLLEQRPLPYTYSSVPQFDTIYATASGGGMNFECIAENAENYNVLCATVSDSVATLGQVVDHSWSGGDTVLNLNPAGDAYLVISGAGSSEVNDTFWYEGVINSKPYWYNDEGVAEAQVSYDSGTGEWLIEYDTDTFYRTNDQPLHPADGTWIVVNGTGPAPTVTRQVAYVSDVTDYVFISSDISDVFTALAQSGTPTDATTFTTQYFTNGDNGESGILGQHAIISTTNTVYFKTTGGFPNTWVALN